jgi:Ca2+-dependent lipid-binding protein
VRLVFATHDVLAKGAGLQALLEDVAAHRLVGLNEPTRAERFGTVADQCIRELSVHRVES